jgi:hypothetical protein
LAWPGGVPSFFAWPGGTPSFLALPGGLSSVVASPGTVVPGLVASSGPGSFSAWPGGTPSFFARPGGTPSFFASPGGVPPVPARPGGTNVVGSDTAGSGMFVGSTFGEAGRVFRTPAFTAASGRETDTMPESGNDGTAPAPPATPVVTAVVMNSPPTTVAARPTGSVSALRTVRTARVPRVASQPPTPALAAAPAPAAAAAVLVFATVAAPSRRTGAAARSIQNDSRTSTNARVQPAHCTMWSSTCCRRRGRSRFRTKSCIEARVALHSASSAMPVWVSAKLLASRLSARRRRRLAAYGSTPISSAMAATGRDPTW